jgi:hypothetical protein
MVHVAPPSAEPAASVTDLLRAFRDGLGPILGRAFDGLADRLELRGAGAAAYFDHPLALPVLELPSWAADLARSRGVEVPSAAVESAVAAAAFGYLHVRVEDDLLDEGTGEGPETLLLSHALFSAHLAELGRAAPPGSRAFWDLVSATWRGYAEAMALERRLQSGLDEWTEERFERVLDRTMPLALPPAALLAAAGLEVDLPALLDLARHVARAHQLHVDLVDVEKDAANGNRTWIGQRLGATAGQDALRRRLFAGGGLDALAGEVFAGLAAARERATSLGLDGLAAWISRREALVEWMLRDVFRTFFDHLLLSSPDEP